MAGIRKRIPLEQDVWSLACERTAHVFDTFDHVNVSFSGGKDSTAVLFLALAVAHSDPRFARHLPLRVIHYDEEASPYETEQFVRRVGQRDDVALEWYCLPVQQRNACARRSPYWWPWAPEAQDRWCRPLPPEARTELPGFPLWPAEQRPSIPHLHELTHDPAHGNHAQLLGIRAEESLNRLRMVSRKPVDNYISPGGAPWVSKVYPIYDWTVGDIWTATAEKGWDYNRAYDHMAMAGVPAGGQRCSPAFGEEPIKGLHLYATCFPDVWEKMIERVPGVGAAYRYARTELYSSRSRPDKPADLTWHDFLRHYLVKHAPAQQATIARRLQVEIRSHYRKTSHPILVEAPHPATGVSWHYLLMLAMRGDLKQRRHAGNYVPHTRDEIVLAWRRYTAELESVLDAQGWADLAAPGQPPAHARDLVPAHLREALTP